ncbi:ABC transporter permease [Virgibacillus sp. SK37]|uniref:ABC transporter permease n=1 Tax=Virgibacillus sp. SK37 TaxID=403957 RepID=UPI0004D14564|nr:ABC transporter permease [Virgibacillus sp. SK37]AIF45376.1 hypothetical protein X953_08860 [Virgibacillus sp. SK37]
MKAILTTRLLFWKRQKGMLLFWMLLPIILTFSIIMVIETAQGNGKIPVGIVLQEKTDYTDRLLKELNNISSLQVEVLTEEEALHQIEIHKLDSAFIIKEGYTEKILKGSRNRLISGIRSDLSFGYTPVSEAIQSIIQQDTGRVKAAFTVQQLSKVYDSSSTWTIDEIVKKSKEIEKQQNLLQTSFSFTTAEESPVEKKSSLVNPWGLWAIFSFLSTLLLYDWLIKEKTSPIYKRFTFTKFSFKMYAIQNSFIYLCLFLLFDIITVSLFTIFLTEPISLTFIISLVMFRLTLIMAAFTLALLFKNAYLYYVFSFSFSLIVAITSGSIIPMDRLPEKISVINSLHPLQPFLHNEIGFLWFILLSAIVIFWHGRKGKSDAHY